MAKKNDADKVYKELSLRATEIYRFVARFYNHMQHPRDYGTGEIISMVEIHALSAIDDAPGITASELTVEFERTKGAISQTIAKLEKQGYIYRETTKENAKTVHLYTTQKGRALSIAHKKSDKKNIRKSVIELLKFCSPEEIDTFLKVIHLYCRLLE
ncbi:MAG: MarR family transcriptional regulator [Treponema sp.]|jgi:DNA-binding MarR family transcriptional regulator|nr:MarR family transcriptional regulator [Treponema sp.]